MVYVVDIKGKLIVIRGTKDSGKTTTCWKLLNLLKPFVEYYEYWDLRGTNPQFFNSDGVDLYKYKIGSNFNVCDFLVVFTIKVKMKLLKVAIISAGDEAWVLRRDIFQILMRQVDIIVCCARMRNEENSSLKMLKDEFGVKNLDILKLSGKIEEDKIAQEIKEKILNF